MIETRPGPSSPQDPLSRPLASFNGHSAFQHADFHGESSRPYPSTDHDSSWGENGHARQVEEALDASDGDGDAEWTSQPLRLDPSSPKVNPFHLLSNPGSTSPLPPLPKHLQSLVSDTDPPSAAHEGENTVVQQFRSIATTTDSGPPIHITKVSKNTVYVETAADAANGRGPMKMINKVTDVFRKSNGQVITQSEITETRSNGDGNVVNRQVPMQGLPPSPPISEVEIEVEESEDGGSRSVVVETTEESFAPTQQGEDRRESLFTSDITAEPSDMADTPAKPFTPARRLSWNSASSRTGSLAVVRNSRLAKESSQKREEPPKETALPAANDRMAVERSDSGATTSSDYLHPMAVSPVSQHPRISRRNTGPAGAASPVQNNALNRLPLIHSQSTFSGSSPPLRSHTSIPGLDGVGLDSDILAEAEILRQKRLERRQKKAEAAENAAGLAEARHKPEQRKQTEETKVLVGNLIGEDHVNYVLMYNMLTGIRIGVSRCQAKIKRPLTDEDYTARHKFSFDIIGNELTPSARYDFKFKDYAPWVFRELRDEHFHLDPADYLLSLTAKYILSELGSPGKSGSFFYFSRDYRFIIKTISHSEHKFLRSILRDYYDHVKGNPHTLLSRFYGLHRVKLPRGRKIHFVIMNNLFPPHRDIHETYDLKGSAFGREYDEEKAKKNPKAVLKDKNWVNRGRTLELGPEKRALLTEQLRRDMEFLKRMKVMDYSLLVGIHNMERGNRDNLRENQLHVFHPEMPTRRKPTIKGPAHDVRKAIRRSDPKMLDVSNHLPSADSADRRHFLFYQDEGGLRATDEANQDMDVIYYLGVIDICTPYNTLKRMEHFWKSMTEDRTTISCVDPITYGQRFINFLMSVMRGGNLALRPTGLEPPQREVNQRPVGERDEENRVTNDAVLGGETSHSARPVTNGENGFAEKPAVVGHLKTE